jgi:hypothetical protein
MGGMKFDQWASPSWLKFQPCSLYPYRHEMSRISSHKPQISQEFRQKGEKSHGIAEMYTGKTPWRWGTMEIATIGKEIDW